MRCRGFCSEQRTRFHECLRKALLPGRLDCSTRVVVSNVVDGCTAGHTVERDEARERCASSPHPTGARDLDPLGCAAAQYFSQYNPEFLRVGRKPEVGPTNPSAVPVESTRIPALQVDSEIRPWAVRHRIAQGASTNETARRQPQHTRRLHIPHVTQPSLASTSASTDTAVSFTSPARTTHRPRLRYGAYDDDSARKGNVPVRPVNPHRQRKARTEGWALQYLAQWRRRVEYLEDRVDQKPRALLDNRVPILAGFTGCPACDGHFFGDGPRDALERLMRRDGRRAHRLRVAVARLDQRYRDVTVEIDRSRSMPWWERRAPWA